MVSLPPNFGRAVDLSSLGKPVAAKPNISYGKEVTDANLATEFVTLSRSQVVILLCWSARSQESVLVLETMARLQGATGGAWTLGSVDVDGQPQVAQALQVRTLPYAVALVSEQVMPLFEQSYPEAQLRAVIDKVLGIAAEQGIGKVVEEKLEPEEEVALAALDANDLVKAEAAYLALLARKPQDPFAKLGLAHTRLLIRTSKLDPKEIFAAAEASPELIELQIQCADCEVISGDIDSAFKRLLSCIRRLEGAEKVRVKDHLLELFTLADPSDPRLIKARGALANALY